MKYFMGEDAFIETRNWSISKQVPSSSNVFHMKK
jgi:hypothetical protein